MEIECSSPLVSSAENPPAAADTRQYRAEEVEKPETQGKSGSSKALALLDTLFERMNADLADVADPGILRRAQCNKRTRQNQYNSKQGILLVGG